MTTLPIRCFEGKAQPQEAFWRFQSAAETGGDPAVQFYGVISEWSWLDDEITPKKFKDELTRIGQGGPVTLKIDSPGGDPIAASAIAAIISQYPGKVTALVEGQASSAAVIVALSASAVRMMESAYMMIHNPMISVFMAALDVATMQKMIPALESIKAGLVTSYASRTGLPEGQIAQMMDDTTWMSAQEAVDNHFADEVVPVGQKRKVRSFQNLLQHYQHVPAALLNVADAQLTEAEEPPTEETQAAPEGTEETPAETDAQTPPVLLAAQKLALARAKTFHSKGATMFIRELIQKRSTLLAEAQGLVATAEQETRDLTADERARFVAIMGQGETAGELAVLDQQIEQVEAEREQLRVAAEKKFSNRQSIKPEPPAPGKTMKRGEFEALSVADQAAFVRAGGKVQD